MGLRGAGAKKPIKVTRVRSSLLEQSDWKRKRSRVARVISFLENLPITKGILAGTKMKLLDAMILATAQVNGAILVTRNTTDFPAQMPGIRVPYVL